MPIQIIPLGTPTPILQNVVYALPSCASFIMADAGVEVSQSISGPWTSLTSGTRTAASFIRCLSGNTTITAKSSRSVKGGQSVLTYAQRVAADGATNYWRLNETSGLVAVDSIGGANGTISGGVTLNQAGAVQGGKSMLFDASSGKIGMGNITFTIPMTIEFFGKTTYTGNQAALCNSIGGAVDNPGWFGTGSVGAPVINLYGVVDCTGLTIINNGQWHHLAVVSNGSTAVFYVDGVLDSSPAFVRATPSTHPGWIGWIPPDPTRFWNGSLAEIAIYPRALSPAEIASHYALR